jgi:hypothetical protein
MWVVKKQFVTPRCIGMWCKTLFKKVGAALSDICSHFDANDAPVNSRIKYKYLLSVLAVD